MSKRKHEPCFSVARFSGHASYMSDCREDCAVRTCFRQSENGRDQGRAATLQMCQGSVLLTLGRHNEYYVDNIGLAVAPLIVFMI